MYSVTGRSKDYICFNMYCTFTGRMSELLDLQHLECFQKCRMLISSPFFFAVKHSVEIVHGVGSI